MSNYYVTGFAQGREGGTVQTDKMPVLLDVTLCWGCDYCREESSSLRNGLR